MKKIALLACIILALVILSPSFTRPSARVVRQLVVREKPVPSDAILVFLGGAALERIDLAHKLYAQGMAPQIVFCDGFEISGWKSWWYRKSGWIPFGKKYLLFLRRLNLNDNAIQMISCPKIDDTASEIVALSRSIKQKGYRRVLLITSASHSRRASLIWRRLVPDVDGIMVAARDPRLEWWWSTRHGRTAIMYEYLALAKELIRTHIGF